MTLAAAGIVVAFFIYRSTPNPPDLDLKDLNQTSIIYDRTGEHELYEIYGEENRKVIPYDQIPDIVRIATIASEDDGFYSHSGIDLKSIIRALKTDIETKKVEQGGSTITQQLARNLFLTREKTIKRKINEIVLAIKLEKRYSKNQILDMYLNTVPYGSNAYGIETASETFFGKKASKLTLDEAAMLAALPKATSYYSPYGENINDLINRQQWILNRISELNLIDSNTVQDYRKIITSAKIIPKRDPIDSPHFVFFARDTLEKEFGRELLETKGLKIYTTLDYDMQKLAEKTVAEGVIKNQSRSAENASLVAIDPRSGQILSMVGSRNYFDADIDGQVNVALSLRQPGSSFKPFAYCEAFIKGYLPETLVVDAPTNFGPDGSGKNYIPHNYDGAFHGVVTMRQALAMSLNIPAVKTLYVAGVDDTINLAQRMGISTLDDGNYGLSLVLGGGAVTLLDETSGYGVFANDGKRNPATPILKIENSHGEIIYSNSPKNDPVLDSDIARKINSILSDNSARAPVFGTNSRLQIPDQIVAAKTGTSQEYRDGWTIGYTPSLVVGVWAGNNNNRPMRDGSAGLYVAAPIWSEFMSQAIKNSPKETFLAYDQTKERDLIATRKNLIEISYYNKNTGKKLSEKKKNKTDPEKIETRIEFSNIPSNEKSFASLESQNSNDPVISKWSEPIQFSTDFIPFKKDFAID